ncbi:hypothetical protein [Actinomadura decatromicini]|uniref:hypothetical protein n=1 Tax=Actinomadura decatromicini TaxID=2604572 RepID=UPI00165339C3|nr:hypothetical protein [Actinomadura decatromicini]
MTRTECQRVVAQFRQAAQDAHRIADAAERDAAEATVACEGRFESQLDAGQVERS